MIIRQILRGLIGAACLALFSVCASALLYRWLEGHIVGKKWPYLETRRIWMTCAPAMIFWLWYFARHWRGRDVVNECWTKAKPLVPILAVSVFSALVCWFLFSDSFLRGMYGYNHGFGESTKAEIAAFAFGGLIPGSVHLVHAVISNPSRS